jgi:hypothetical protein
MFEYVTNTCPRRSPSPPTQVFLSPNSTLPIGVATLTVNSVSAPGYTYNSLASQLAYTFNWP